MRQYNREAQRGRLAERLRGSEAQRIYGKWQMANAQRNMNVII